VPAPQMVCIPRGNPFRRRAVSRGDESSLDLGEVEELKAALREAHVELWVWKKRPSTGWDLQGARGDPPRGSRRHATVPSRRRSTIRIARAAELRLSTGRMDARGNAGDDLARPDVARDDGAGADRSPFSDPDATHDDRPRAERRARLHD
jgi:hypothetical protein